MKLGIFKNSEGWGVYEQQGSVMTPLFGGFPSKKKAEDKMNETQIESALKMMEK